MKPNFLRTISWISFAMAVWQGTILVLPYYMWKDLGIESILCYGVWAIELLASAMLFIHWYFSKEEQ